MHLKRYEVGDMAEALARIKRDLGPDAIILSTRKLRKRKGIFGLVGGALFEVIAASERQDPDGSRQQGPSNVQRPTSNVTEAGAGDVGRRLDVLPTEPAASGLDSLRQEVRTMRGEVHALQGLLSKPPGLGIESRVVEARRAKPETRNRSKKGSRLPTRFKGLHQQLLGHGVAADVARQLLEEVHAARPGRVRRKEGDLEEALKQVMIGKLKVLEPRASGGRSPSLMAFVGPTGVGKTTTIAKLAATSTLMAGKRVAMVTLDTYRIAAVEQLKVYGKIIGTPVTVAVNPEEVGRVLREARGLDLILIDTPGRCHRNAEQVWELKALLSQPWPLEVHLVLSATTREEEAVEMIRQFSLIPFHSLLFTKLDESGALGSLFNLAVRAAKPISYLTTGQRVPEDIEAATPERIVDIVLHGFWR